MNTESLEPHYARAAALSYYEGPEIVERLRAALTKAGLDPDALDIDDLAPLDEFHALGRAATLALAELAGVHAGQRVLDVGAGIGGPARVLAAHYGANVTALDTAARFCQAAEMLTRGAGLGDRVKIVCANALDLPFADGTFDLAWSQAVSQNIADKERFVVEMTRVIRPRGHLALFEVIAGPGGLLEFPVPWADREDESWLVTPEDLRELLHSSRLDLVAWREGQDALDAMASAAPRVKQPSSEHRLGLHILMPDFEERMAGLARNVAQQKLALVQIVAKRRP